MVMLFNTKNTQCVVMVMVLCLLLFANSAELDEQEKKSIEGLFIMHNNQMVASAKMVFDDENNLIYFKHQTKNLEYINKKITPDESLKKMFPNIKYSLKEKDGISFWAINDDNTLNLYRYDMDMDNGISAGTTLLKVNASMTNIEEETKLIKSIESTIESLIQTSDYQNLLNKDRETRNADVKNHFKYFLQQPESNITKPRLIPNDEQKSVSNVSEAKSIPNYDNLWIPSYAFIFIVIMVGIYAGLKTWKRNQQYYGENEDDEEVSNENDENIDSGDDEGENDESDGSIDSGNQKVNEENASVTSDEEGKVNEKNDERSGSNDEEVSRKNEEGIVKKDEEVNKEGKEGIDSGDEVKKKNEEGIDKKDEDVNKENEEVTTSNDKDDSSSDWRDFSEVEGQLPIPAHMFLHNDPIQPQYL